MSTFARPAVSFKPAFPAKARRPRHPKPRPKPRPRPNPRASWPSWTDEVRYAIAPEAPADDTPAYVPTPQAVAWNQGWELGYEHDRSAAPSSELAPDLQLSWRAGWSAGWISRDEVDALIDRRQAANSITDADAWPLGCVS